MSMFKKKVTGQASSETVIGGYPKDNGPKCPNCGSRKTVAIWRDMVWDETGCKCEKCGMEFIK